MKRILRQNGLPEDLIYIALIESGFSAKATSHAAAVGYWQFIRGTGKRYGLEINTLVDERRDPVLSTQAAAEYYKMLYGEFNSWYLSMASYNVGENRVRREIIRNGTRDFWTLARKRRLPKETINYVPKFLAARMIGNDPAKYGFSDIESEPPIEFELIRYNQPVNLKKLAEKLNLDYDDFKLLNPKFRGEIAPAKNNGVLELKVPIGMTQVALNVIQEAAVEKVEYIADTGDTDIYRVRRGDSIYTIARRHRTTIGWLKDVNDLKPGRKLRIGQRMIVPVGKQPASKAQAKRATPPAQETNQAKANVAVTSSEVIKGNAVFYIVQPGDTLSEIAEDYDSTVRELRKMNKLGKRLVLRPGMRLKVPKDEGLPADPTEDPKRQDEMQKVEGDPSDGAVPANTRKAKQNSAVAKANKKPETSRRAIASTAKLAKKIHRVRRGENLYQIAQKYRVSYSDLITMNKKLKRGPLYVGAAVVIPRGEIR
jgi:membrane-bound lytic murein transglycosylase D